MYKVIGGANFLVGYKRRNRESGASNSSWCRIVGLEVKSTKGECKYSLEEIGKLLKRDTS